VEPTYKWHPVTDFYKEQQAAQPIDAEAEIQQKLHEVREAAKKTGWAEKKAPIGIRVFTWYLFCRVGIFALLLAILAVLPQSSTSAWLVGNLKHQLPGAAARERAAKQREEFKKQAEAQGYTLPDYIVDEEKSPEQLAQEQREFVMVYLFLMTVLTSVVGFMWWNRSWKVRWAAMFYAGAFVAKAAVGLFAGWASGVGNRLTPSESSALVIALGVNGFIFCYLAFWPEVGKWFDNE